jgi:uncharacterized protein YndB with AHSA1/START domain
MKTQNNSAIKVEADVKAPIKKVWGFWTAPEHITKWNQASGDWHSPRAENDLREGGKFVTRMEAKDGSAGFDFGGTYDQVEKNKLIAYTMDDGRKVEIHFSEDGDTTHVIETFEPEEENSREMQQSGWQAILDNFKKYVETNSEIDLQKIHFSVGIDAPKEKVWNTMLNDETYRKWTSAFAEGAEGSYFEGSWDEGSDIRFMGPEGNGGMISVIAENRPYEFISIKHIGIINDGVVDTDSEEAQKWAPAFENYSFSENNGKTTVSVDMDIEEEYEDMFKEMWPKALKKLKELSED